MGKNQEVIDDNDHPIKEIFKNNDHGLVETETSNGNTFLHEGWLVVAPWCYNGEHAGSLLSDSKLVETIFEVDVGKDWIVGYAVDIESNIREWPMVSDDILVDDPEITTNTHIWGVAFEATVMLDATGDVEGMRK